jgi:hypothetical protein
MMPENRSLAISIPLLLILSACAHPGGSATDIPQDAIKLRDNYYMLPIGADDDGCAMFRPYAPGMMTDQAIRFRRADGSFTMAREEAACPGRT